MDKETRFFERIVRSHYWLKMPEVVERIAFENRTFFSKYKRMNAPLDDRIVNEHRAGVLTAAHSLVSDAGTVPHIVIDYNGDAPKHFYHHSGRVLDAMGYSDLITFRSKTPSHMHLYIACDDAALQDAIEVGKIVSGKLEEKLTRQWRVYPTETLPKAYNIMNLPYEPFSLSPRQGAADARPAQRT